MKSEGRYNSSPFHLNVYYKFISLKKRSFFVNSIVTVQVRVFNSI